jgi:hypothetical protein
MQMLRFRQGRILARTIISPFMEVEPIHPRSAAARSPKDRERAMRRAWKLMLCMVLGAGIGCCLTTGQCDCDPGYDRCTLYGNGCAGGVYAGPGQGQIINGNGNGVIEKNGNGEMPNGREQQ